MRLTQLTGGFGTSVFAPERRYPDILGVATLLVATSLAAWEGLRSSVALFRFDITTFFLPTFAFLGEHLHAGDIPGWNPHQFAGAPFAGDPGSGWMYLPAMFFFTLLPPIAAFKAFVTFHLLLAALATYALGRILGMGAMAATVAGTAFALGPFLEHTRCCTVYAIIPAWLPVAMLGIELALRDGSRLVRVAWLALAGFAVSQMLGAWIGQGAYYGLLTVGAYLAYRTVLAPADRRPIRNRVATLVGYGAALLAIAFALAAAGVLPRLDVNARSTLAGGVYGGDAAYAASRAWWTVDYAVHALLSPSFRIGRWYAGGAALSLALLAPLLARRRHAVAFFAPLCLVVPLLVLEGSPLPHVFSLLPRFDVLHAHSAERIMIVFYFGCAMLVGATVEALVHFVGRPGTLFALAPVPLFALVPASLFLWQGEPPDVPASTFNGITIAVLLVAVIGGLAYLGRRSRHVAAMRWMMPVLFFVAVWWDPTGRALVESLTNSNATQANWSATMVARYADTTGEGEAGAFLRDARADGPFRFFGYDAALLVRPSGRRGTYLSHYARPETQDLLLNNRAMRLGLDDIQGYNPMHVARYDELIFAVNGRSQEYHEQNVLSTGLDSPLLDLLNVRFVVVPRGVPPGRPDLLHLSQRWPTVYRDDRVRVLENRNALPRAWLVHDAEEVAQGQALPLLATGAVDPRRTALLEEPLPPLAQPTDPDADQVAIRQYEANRIDLAVETDAPALLVLSEVYDPGWHAYVDGRRVQLYVANHTLRSVPVPAGDHQVELRYEPRSLWVGMAISITAYGLLAGLAAALIARRVAVQQAAAGRSGSASRWPSRWPAARVRVRRLGDAGKARAEMRFADSDTTDFGSGGEASAPDGWR